MTEQPIRKGPWAGESGFTCSSSATAWAASRSQGRGAQKRIPEELGHTRELAHWNSALLTFLLNLEAFCSSRDIKVDRDGLPAGVRRLLELATAVPEKKDARPAEGRVSFLAILGNETVNFFRSAGELLAFIGETVMAMLQLVRGRAGSAAPICG